MSIRIDVPKAAVIAVDGKEPFTPEQIVEQLRLLRQHIPDFGPLPVPDAASLRRVAHIDDAMVQAAANTVGASPYVASAIGKEADGMRNERVDVGRWSAVEDELRTMFKGVASANLARRHRLGLAALQTYSISRQLVRQREHAHLLPHVEEMRRLVKFGGRKRRPADDPAVAKPAVTTPAVTAPAPVKP